MQQASPNPQDTQDQQLFDVVVHLPSGAKLEVILEKAVNEAGIEPTKAEALVNALRSVPSAKVGASVTRERADKARLDLTKAGLTVEVTPVLSLAAAVPVEADGRFLCPACNTRVVLSEQRQCPSCGVFVDKVTDDFLMRKKIMDQEKARLDFARDKELKDLEKRNKDLREQALRKQIRDELEKEYGISKGGLLGRFPGVTKIAGIGVLLAMGFAGGRFVVLPGSADSKAAPAAAATPAAQAAAQSQDIDKMLAKAGEKATGAVDPELADPDAEDSLVRGDRKGKGKISVEQAVAASKVLAGSIGYKVPGEGGGKGGPAGAAPGGAPGAAGAAGGPAAGGADPGGTAAEAAPVPPVVKAELAMEFARDLAEMGQASRSREVVRTLLESATVKADPALAAQAKALDYETQVWSLRGGDARTRQVLDSLRLNAGSLPDPAQRAMALARIGNALARHPTLPGETATAFLTLANEALKQVTDANQLRSAKAAVVTALGYSIVNEIAARARAGEWSKARTAASQLEALVKDAPTTDSVVRLLGIQFQARSLMGQSAGAQQDIDVALSLIAKESSLEARAALLRSLGTASQASRADKLQAAFNQLAEAARSKTGREKAATLGTLAVAHAEAGQPERAEQLRKEAGDAPGLAAADLSAIQAQALIRVELAGARAAHDLRAYAQAESQLQKVADYLL